MTTPSMPNQPPPLPRGAIPGRFAFEPMPGRSPVQAIEALLKYPGRIMYELQSSWSASLSAWLLLFALLGMALYGVVVGTFSGGAQLWIAPVKLALGTLVAVAICLPSLYIFACLGGIDTRLRVVSGVFFAGIALSALLLIGFAPVAWIFSQSTDSVSFMGTLHLSLWAIGSFFGLRLVGAMNRLFATSAGGILKLWGVIFVTVCLQMTTTLRPIIAPAKSFLPPEKKFFLANWFESLNPPQPPRSDSD